MGGMFCCIAGDGSQGLAHARQVVTTNLNPSHTWSFAFIGYHCSKYRFSLVRCFPALIGIVGTAVADTANISFSPGPAKEGHSDLGLWQ